MPQAPRNYKELQVPPSIFTLPKHLALIIDGIVENILHLNEDEYNLFMSNPNIVLLEPETSDGMYTIQISNDSKTQKFYFTERDASIILSSPTFKEVNITSSGGPDIGYLYDLATDTFTANQ